MAVTGYPGVQVAEAACEASRVGTAPPIVRVCCCFSSVPLLTLTPIPFSLRLSDYIYTRTPLWPSRGVQLTVFTRVARICFSQDFNKTMTMEWNRPHHHYPCLGKKQTSSLCPNHLESRTMLRRDIPRALSSLNKGQLFLILNQDHCIATTCQTSRQGLNPNSIMHHFRHNHHKFRAQTKG